MTDQTRNPHKRWAIDVLANTSTQLIGMDEIIRLCIVAYCAGGHVLLEGNPGLGKTTLIKRLAKAIRLQEGRIQFTPDLMPADITGTVLPSYANGSTGQWAFEPGPIFASLLLADEINRATPKTQSALLEAMAEGQTTVLGQTYRLPQPFVVMATQNPLDHSGTYALPEAQADRFMFKLIMPVPGSATVRQIINHEQNQAILRDEESGQPRTGEQFISPRRTLFAAFNREHVTRSHNEAELALLKSYDQARVAFTIRARLVEKSMIHPGLEQHLVNIFLASHKRYSELEKQGTLSREGLNRLRTVFEPIITDGLGPRAVINLAKAARAWAFCFGTTITADDVPTADAIDLAHVLTPTLYHRLKLSFGWEQHYKDKGLDRRSLFDRGDDLMASLIADFAYHTAPVGQGPNQTKIHYGNYKELLRAELEKVLSPAEEKR